MLRLFMGFLGCFMDLGGSLDLDSSSDLDYPRLIFVVLQDLDGSSDLDGFSLDLVGFFRGYGCFSGVRSFNLYIY